MGCVYLVTNRVNGKQYVGKTIRDMKQRRAVHEAFVKRGSTSVLASALRKYGFESFDWEVIEESEDPVELNHLEIENIKWFGSLAPRGYNASPGGDGNSGFARSEEWKEKVRRKLLGHPVSAETRKKISESIRRMATPERRLKLSRALRGKRRGPCSPETKAKIGLANSRILKLYHKHRDWDSCLL